jgi:membrane-associated protein
MGAGFLFGNVPIIKDNFTLVTIGIVIVSVLPMVYEYVKHRKQSG